MVFYCCHLAAAAIIIATAVVTAATAVICFADAVYDHSSNEKCPEYIVLSAHSKYLLSGIQAFNSFSFSEFFAPYTTIL